MDSYIQTNNLLVLLKVLLVFGDDGGPCYNNLKYSEISLKN